MPSIVLPTMYVPYPTLPQPVTSGKAYIGEVNEDPTIEINRIAVTVIQQDGTPVTVPGSAQPFTLTAGGVFVYNNTIVQLRADQNYSMAIHSSGDVPLYYFPSCVEGGSTISSIVILPAIGSTPSPLADTGQLYTKLVAGIAELFYLDDEGNEIQFTSGGEFNIELSESVLEVLRLLVEEQIEASQFRGDPVELVIDGDGNVTLDMSLGTNYALTLTQNVNEFRFSNAPSVRLPSLLVDIINTGSFTITTFAPTQAGYELWKPATVDSLQPVPNTRTSYGLALMPDQIINIFPVEMVEHS